MTSPDGALPEGSLVPGLFRAMQLQTEEEAKAAATGGALGGFEDAQESYWEFESDVAGTVGEALDEQLELNERVDLLEGVNGYCMTFMSKNWLIPSQRKVVLPFDTQLGPNVGASPFEGGIRLDTKGLWRTDFLIGWEKSPPGNPWSAGIYLEVYNHVADTSYSESLFAIVVTPAGHETVAFSKTFVIPADDTYMVRAHAWQGTTTQRRVFGGTTWSALSVNKWSNNTDHNIDIPEAPEGGMLS
ncbi:hypothetical protein RDE2_07950 [Rhodococcus sp. RDE2]|nr:hypothetical protein RDE2_07950 [Rhodococcus sp. RDE2]